MTRLLGPAPDDLLQRTRTSSHDRPIRLSAAHAYALAELLDVLAVGEDSAASTFEYMADRCGPAQISGALKDIAADETRHQRWLADLKQALPSPTKDPAVRSLLRRFFSRLADRDMRVHLVRIVALDSAVCQLLGALQSPGSPLSGEATTRSVLRKIQRDEARHVAVARQCATPLVGTPRGRDLMAEAREGLVHVLAFDATAFDTLSVDPDRLFVRLRRIPRQGVAS